MYRARVQAVSGSKVLAGGKWLQCIGNQPVSVGERVWTDGRVVFGNYTIPQTPIISISKDEDTIIPIVTTKNFYAFDKGKLKQETKQNSEIKLLTNNKKKLFITDPNFCLAINVDKQGNIFALIDDGDNVQIKVNDRTVKTLTYAYLTDIAQSLCPSTNPTPPGKTHTSAESWPFWGFIENENNWAFMIFSSCDKSTIGEFYLVKKEEITSYSVCMQHFFSNTGVTLLDIEHTHIYQRVPSNTYEGVFAFDSFSSPGRDQVHFPLQDGYYYTAPSTDAIISYTGSDYTLYNRSTFTETRKIFTPNGNMIFEAAFNQAAYISLKKVSSGYLLGVNATVWDIPLREGDIWQNPNYGTYYPNYSRNQLWISGGLYLIKNGKAEQLVNERVFNQCFCPMKKIKNWPKRIEEISFD